IDHLAEAEFVGRIILRCNQSFLAAGVIDFDEQQSGFDASYVERQHAGSVNVEAFADFHYGIPDFYRVVPGQPDFVSQIAGVAGARNIHGDACDLPVSHAEILRLAMSASATAFSSLPDVGPCKARAATFSEMSST